MSWSWRAAATLAFLLGGALALSSVGCSKDAPLLVVDVKTDYVPGIEFVEVRNEIVRAEGLDGGLASRTTMTVAASTGQDYVEGERTAEFDIDKPGVFIVTTSLHAQDGAVVGKRTTRVRVDEKQVITVIISRSCGDVECPGPDDPDDATTCVGGECVLPTCTPETPEGCGEAECESDDECMAAVGCAEGRCVDDYCLQVPLEDGCADGEWCSVERGCLPVPGMGDGGMDGGGPCVPEAELCNELDDDCDGSVDEDFDLTSDPDNCGSCGNACSGDHATAVCSAGSCALECDSGWEDCDGDPTNGCEADLTAPATCGDCSTSCSDPTPLCAGGDCIDECPSDAPTLCGGSCVDTDTSMGHCGGCDMPCDPPDGTGTCSGGTCSIESCDAGRDDCDGDVSNGCETDLSAPETCGACGNSCGGSTPYCQPSDGSWACTDGCSDGVRSGDESDADCGGSFCSPCGEGDRCGDDSDCGGTLECSGGVCSSCGECDPGATESRSCGDCGTQTRTCTSTCVWGSWSTCSGEGVCTAGSTETEACGDCGERSRTCDSSCEWGSWSSCSGEGECTPGTTESSSCGNCGTTSRTCDSSCNWGPWETCSGEGPCSPGDTTNSGCDNSCQVKSCDSSCMWGTCSACSGSCSSFRTCESSCPDGNTHHTSSMDGSDCSCGSSGCGTSIYCEPNCGTGFRTCESSCSGGYHISSMDGSDCNCGYSGCGTSVYCEINAGSGFRTCESSCPSGYHISSMDGSDCNCGYSGCGTSVYCEAD